MKWVALLDGEWDLYHFDDVLASQYQSIDWTLHTTSERSILDLSLKMKQLDNRVTGLRPTGV